MKIFFWLTAGFVVSACGSTRIKVRSKPLDFTCPTELENKNAFEMFVQSLATEANTRLTRDEITNSLRKKVKKMAPPSKHISLTCWMEGEVEVEDEEKFVGVTSSVEETDAREVDVELKCLVKGRDLYRMQGVQLTAWYTEAAARDWPGAHDDPAVPPLIDFLGHPGKEVETPRNTIKGAKLYHISTTEQEDGRKVDFIRVEAELSDGTKLIEYFLGNYDELLSAYDATIVSLTWRQELSNGEALMDEETLQKFVDDVAKAPDARPYAQVETAFIQALEKKKKEALEKTGRQGAPTAYTLVCEIGGLYDPEEKTQDSTFSVLFECKVPSKDLKSEFVVLKGLYELGPEDDKATLPLLGFLAQGANQDGKQKVGDLSFHLVSECVQPSGDILYFFLVEKELSESRGKLRTYHIGNYQEYLSSLQRERKRSGEQSPSDEKKHMETPSNRQRVGSRTIEETRSLPPVSTQSTSNSRRDSSPLVGFQHRPPKVKEGSPLSEKPGKGTIDGTRPGIQAGRGEMHAGRGEPSERGRLDHPASHQHWGCQK